MINVFVDVYNRLFCGKSQLELDNLEYDVIAC